MQPLIIPSPRQYLTFCLAATLKAPFLNSCIFPSVVRVPSGKKSREQPLSARLLQAFRASIWLLRLSRTSGTCPAPAEAVVAGQLRGGGRRGSWLAVCHCTSMSSSAWERVRRGNR